MIGPFLPAAAAIAYGPGDDVDTPMAECATVLSALGFRIGGLLQRFGAPVGPCKREMLLTLLPGRETIRLSEPRGRGAVSCMLDADALARAAVALRAAIEAQPDILIVSRFGKEEASGCGLRAELAEAMLRGIPVLVAVKHSLLPDWRGFLGSDGVVLPPRAHELLTWAGAPPNHCESAAACALASMAR